MTMFLMHIAIGLPLGYAILSVAEWYVHRYHMHRPGWMNRLEPDLFRDHQRIHHRVYLWDFEHPTDPGHADTGVPSGFSGPLRVAAPLALLVGVALPVEGLVMMAMAACYPAAWTAFHREMHQPRGRWFARTAWYRICREHHREHHLRPSRNFNALFLGADSLLGTRA